MTIAQTIQPGAPAFDQAFTAQLATLFQWRRDVRHFRPEPVPAVVLEWLLEMANLAPSVGLSQPWRFVTVDDPVRRAAVRANFEACNAAALLEMCNAVVLLEMCNAVALSEMCNADALSHQDAGRAARYARLKLAGFDEAPCQFAVFAEPDPAQGGGLGRATMPETAAYSAVMAVHTLWLAARAMRLGLGWVSILDPAAVTQALDVPAHWTFIGYFCLGYPQTESATPELERAGWEVRQPVQSATIRR